MLWRAERAGSHIGTLCNLIYRQQGEVGIRRILGVLSLAKKFGTAATEDACAAALEMGVHEYRFVRRYLERGPQLSLKRAYTGLPEIDYPFHDKTIVVTRCGRICLGNRKINFSQEQAE